MNLAALKDLDVILYFLPPLIEIRGLGSLDQSPVRALAKITIETAAGRRQGVIEVAKFFLPGFQMASWIVAVGLDEFEQPAIAEEFATVVDEDLGIGRIE